jgi:D-alanyl-lipoteichoic acid acyltransferase DltB (MBOAT superfamily)
VAGPIERARHLLPQILQRRSITRAQVYDGSWLVFWGLYKKVFVADNLARIVDRVYAAPGDFSAWHVAIATYAFAMQIYCDFSGYTDIARGIGKIMGFEICLNFDIPYAATNPSDFWRRWHISLSRWIRDYLYIPLGGNRGTRRRVFANLMITMALGGLWHGAQWHFVIWGLFHGLLLVGYQLASPTREVGHGAPAGRRALQMLLMFHLTCIGWVLFRAESIGDAATLFSRLFVDWQIAAGVWTDAARLVGYSLLVVVMQVFQYRRNDRMVVWRLPVWARTLLYVAIYLSLVLGGVYEARQFIYFQF